MAEDWILKTIVAKSDQLNACDLIAGPETVTVTNVKEGPADQPVIIEIGKERQPYKPCKSMRRVLVAAWGAKVSQWIGRKMVVYCDPTVKWGGEDVGGIRISHLSHIEQPCVVQLNVTRGKKGTWTVAPIGTGDIESRVQKVIHTLGQCDTDEKVAEVMRRAKQVYAEASDEQRARIDAAKASR